ncbi:hypothetical protein A6R71_03955 [Xanthomonas translucens pv. arrhenatheri]|nr:type II toxin-antitoxin system RelE/ParE family toxin [Xanthomonas translucens]OAX66477.1 hypothetical protein A6R71_03955 [Xanthomonas translucens pv. arrhenatheri]
MNIVWTEPAVDSLQAIRDYVAHDSVFYADLFVNRLIDAAESLRRSPSAAEKCLRPAILQCASCFSRVTASSIARTRQLSKFSPSCMAHATCR